MTSVFNEAMTTYSKRNGDAGGGKSQPRRYGTGKTFRAPTPGLEDVIFGYGAQPGSNPATFKKNSKRLALHIGTTFKKQASEAANMLRTLKKGKEGRPKKPKKATQADEGYIDKETAQEDFEAADLP